MGKQEIYLETLRQRYNLLPLNSVARSELEKQINDKLGFKGFVMNILYAETELASTDSEFIWKVSEIIEKELKKYPGISL